MRMHAGRSRDLTFVIGSLAKVIATLLTYPLMRAKTVMQYRAAALKAHGGGSGSSEKPKALPNGGRGPSQPSNGGGGGGGSGGGMASVLLEILRSEGVGGLYRGCDAQIFTAVSKSGLLLGSKEQIAAYSAMLVLSLSGSRRRQRA